MLVETAATRYLRSRLNKDIQVLVGQGKHRKPVAARLLAVNTHTVVVEMAGKGGKGTKVVKRKIDRDVVVPA